MLALLGIATLGLTNVKANPIERNHNNSLSVLSFQNDGVRVYSDISYKGSSRNLYPGSYNARDLGEVGRSISSLRVPSGYSLIIYTGSNFSGDRMTITHDISRLGDDWNDKIASLRVVRDGDNRYDNDRNGYGNGGYNNYGRNNNNNRGNNRFDYSYLNNRSQVTLFEDDSYGGNRQSLSPGSYSMDRLGIANDALSSIFIPNGFEVTLYKDDNQRGERVTLTSSSRSMPSGWNDAVSSLSIRSTNSSYNNGYNPYNGSSRPRPTDMLDNNQDGITVFSDENFRGNQVRLTPGRYDVNDLGNVGNDAISSIRVPRGYMVTVFSDSGFKGRRKLISSDTGRLGDWNDQISSIIITQYGR